MKRIIVLALVIGAAVAGCNTDECADVNCLNGGVCNDGSCVCPEGFDGEYCQNEVDPCENVTCANGGVCIDGDCICDQGYEGANCEIVSRDKFIGSYNVTETCTQSTDSYALTISAGSVSIAAVTITNLYDAGFVVTGTVDGSSVVIPNQTFGTGTVSGSGTMNGSVLTITFTITAGSQSDTCTLTGS